MSKCLHVKLICIGTYVSKKNNSFYCQSHLRDSKEGSDCQLYRKKTLNSNCFDYEIKYTQYAGHAAVIAKEAADNGIDIVVAITGDGTVNEVTRIWFIVKPPWLLFPVVRGMVWHVI